jgi:hypothetical protein
LPRTAANIVTDIRGFEPVAGNWRPLDTLLGELWATGEHGRHLPELLAVFERFPDTDGAGVLWSIVHGIEEVPAYEPAVLRSAQRCPSLMAKAMIRRMIQAGREHVAGVGLRDLLRQITARPGGVRAASDG